MKRLLERQEKKKKSVQCTPGTKTKSVEINESSGDKNPVKERWRVGEPYDSQEQPFRHHYSLILCSSSNFCVVFCCCY